MKIILKNVFDVNVGKKHRNNFEKMSKALQSYFMERTYSSMLNEMVIDMICSIEFRMKYRKKPVYYEDKLIKVDPGYSDATFRMYHLLFVDIPLPDEFATCSVDNAVAMIGDTMVKYFTEVNLPVKIRKSFDKDRFVADLKAFFDSYSAKQGK